MKTLKTFWCYYNPNFGDALNREMFRALGGFDIEYAPSSEARVAGIGSILDKVLAAGPCRRSAKRALRVFSSGFDADPLGRVASDASGAVRRRLPRALKCFAVRGEKTARALRALEPDISVGVLGDGGLLLKYLVREHVEPRYRVGIVPHYVEREDPIFERIARETDGAVLLDPREGVEPFLHHLRECRTVVSTALHPLIACDALGIPNLWLRLSGSVLSHFKFEDYYSIYGRVPAPLDPRTCPLDQLSEESVRARYAIPANVVAETQVRLKDAFERLCRDLRRPWWLP